MSDRSFPKAYTFVRAADARAIGASAALTADVVAGRLERVRRGIYAPRLAPSPNVARARLEAERYRRAVLAAGAQFAAPVFTSFSAAALYGLPIVGRWPHEIYLMSGRREGRRRTGVVSVGSSTEPVVTIFGDCAVTSVEFSLIQLARHATLAAALVAVDAALFVHPYRPEPLTSIESLEAEFVRMSPFRGSRRVRAVLDRATDRAQTPLETLSRLVMEEFGFAAPELQNSIWLDELQITAHLDFSWPQVGAVGEADGHGKYLGSREVAADTARKVVAEKDRENAIRRRVQAFDRWDWNETLGRHQLVSRLDAMGVPRGRCRPRLIPPLSMPAAHRRSDDPAPR